MEKKFKLFGRLAILATVYFCFVACSNGDDDETNNSLAGYKIFMSNLPVVKSTNEYSPNDRRSTLDTIRRVDLYTRTGKPMQQGDSIAYKFSDGQIYKSLGANWYGICSYRESPDHGGYVVSILKHYDQWVWVLFSQERVYYEICKQL